MHRHWLLTSTFYGTWLPGDERGFVRRVRAERPHRRPSPFGFVHDIPGTPYDENLPGLKCASAAQLTGPPVYLEQLHAEILLNQLRETAQYRGWDLMAVAIMANHAHLV